MSWTRLDDGYDTHGKLLALGDGDKGDGRRWRWTRILIYTNHHGSADIPWNIGETIARVNRKFLNECVALRLADALEDGRLAVHDWPLYADVPIADKVAYCLAKTPDASANDIAKAVGGRRAAALAEVESQRPTAGSPEPPTDPSDPGSPEPGLVVPRAPVSRPDPSRPDVGFGESEVQGRSDLQPVARDEFDVRTLIDVSLQEAS